MASQAITEAIDTTGKPQKTIVGALDLILDQFGISSGLLTSLNAGVSYNDKYASGTKRVGKNTLALTNEKGREMILTKDGILTKLEPDDGVVPNKLTENFFEAAKNYPMMEKMMHKLADGTLVGMTDNAAYGNANASNIEVNQHYDSLIHIDGSADAATVEDIKRLSSDLLEKTYNYTAKRINQDYVRTGGLRRI